MATLTLCIGTVSFTYAQKVKVTTIEYANDAYYTGEVVKKSPMGSGKLVLTSAGNNISLEGTFNGTTVSNANLVFEKYDLEFEGEVSYEVEKVFTFTLKNGSFYSLKEELELCTVGENGINIKIVSGFESSVSGKGEVETVPTLSETKIEQMTQFAGSDNYTCTKVPAVFSIDNNSYNILEKSSTNQSITIQFDNGTIVTINENGENWKRPNGDYIEISSFGLLTEYKITTGEDYIENNIVSKKFSNGNKFLGIVAESLIFPEGTNKDFTCSDHVKLLGVGTINWEWKDLLKYAKSGTLTYSDGEYYEGSLNSNTENITANKLSESAYFDGTLYNADKSKIQTYIKGMGESQYQAEYTKEKATDYFKFDNYGQVAEFKITYPDLAKYIYQYDEKSNTVLENGIYYPNGDIIADPYNNLYDRGRVTNALYKEQVQKTESPNILDPNLLGLRYFNDGLTINVQWVPSFGLGYVIRQKKANGDYATIEVYGKSGRNLRDFQKKFDDCVATSDDKFDNSNGKKGTIYYKNGNKFEGTFKVNYNQDTTLYSDPRLIALGVSPNNKSYESIESVSLYGGRLTSASGKILEIYEKGEKLDDFEFAQRIAKEEGKVRLDQQKREQQKQALLEAEAKYGKANMDAVRNGRIIVGMPEELLISSVNYHILPYLAITLSMDHGRSKCYDLWGVGKSGNLFDPDYKGFVWVTDGKVSSITLY